MNERIENGLVLDRDDFSELNFSQTGINSPLKRPQGHTVVRSYVYTPAERGETIPMYSVSQSAMEMVKRFGETHLTGAKPLANGDLWGQLKDIAEPIGDAPVTEYEVPSKSTRAMARLLADRLMAVAEGQSWPAGQSIDLRPFSKKVFGVPLNALWLPPFMGELREAALDRLNWERCVAKLSELQRAEYTKPPGLLEHAGKVLESTRRILKLGSEEIPLPGWLNTSLVAYLIPRVGFSKGGGARRVLTDRSLTRLLTEPLELIKDLERSPQGARRWEGVIELLRLEVAKAKATVKGTPLNKKKRPVRRSRHGRRANAALKEQSRRSCVFRPTRAETARPLS